MLISTSVAKVFTEGEQELNPEDKVITEEEYKDILLTCLIRCTEKLIA